MSAGFLLHMGSSTVAIDNFSAHQASAFFLTHMHTDHTRGLHDWCEGPIFCSRITQTLLQHKWPALVAPVVPLSLNETTSITLPGHRPFSATSFEANHCPVRFSSLILQSIESRYFTQKSLFAGVCNVSLRKHVWEGSPHWRLQVLHACSFATYYPALELSNHEHVVFGNMTGWEVKNSLHSCSIQLCLVGL